MTKPVALPPGRDMLATKPEPIGSTTLTNTIGTLRLACCKAMTAGVVVPTRYQLSALIALSSCSAMRAVWTMAPATWSRAERHAC